jgi:hypothetical protein
MTRDADAQCDASAFAGDSHVVLIGLVHLCAMGAAIGAAALIRLIDSDVDWPLTGFAATARYLGGTGAGMALRERETRRANAEAR